MIKTSMLMLDKCNDALLNFPPLSVPLHRDLVLESRTHSNAGPSYSLEDSLPTIRRYKDEHRQVWNWCQFIFKASKKQTKYEDIAVLIRAAHQLGVFLIRIHKRHTYL